MFKKGQDFSIKSFSPSKPNSTAFELKVPIYTGLKDLFFFMDIDDPVKRNVSLTG